MLTVPGSQRQIPTRKLLKYPQKGCRPIHLAASLLISALDKQNRQLRSFYFFVRALGSYFLIDGLMIEPNDLSLVQVLIRLLFYPGCHRYFFRGEARQRSAKRIKKAVGEQGGLFHPK